MTTTIFGYTQDQIMDAIDFATHAGWRAETAHDPAPGDRYDDRFTPSAFIILAAPAQDGDGWLTIRTGADGERYVHDVGAYALKSYYRYAPA